MSRLFYILKFGFSILDFSLNLNSFAEKSFHDLSQRFEIHVGFDVQRNVFRQTIGSNAADVPGKL